MKKIFTLLLFLVATVAVSSAATFSTGFDDNKLPANWSGNGSFQTTSANGARWGINPPCYQLAATGILTTETFSNITAISFNAASNNNINAIISYKTTGDWIQLQTNSIAKTSAGQVINVISVSADNIKAISGLENIQIKFSTSAKSLYLDDITIEYGAVDPDAVAVPSISPAGGTYLEDQTVTLTPGDETAVTMYYTTDGSDPALAESTTRTEYTAPFIVSESCTVKAVAYDATKTKYSSATSATFTINKPKEVANIAGFLALANSDVAKITGTIAITFASADGKYIFAQDESGYLMINSAALTGKTYNNGDKITGIIGTVELYANQNMLTANPATTPDAIAGDPILPIQTVAQAFDATSHGKYVTIKMVKLSSKTANGSTITDAAGNTLATYDRFGIKTTFPVSTEYNDIVGILCYYNGTSQIFPISFDKCANQTTTVIGDEITGITNLATEGIGVYKINAPLTVTYQKNNVILANDGVDIKIDGPTEAHVATEFDDNPSDFTHTNWIVLNAMDNTDFTGKQIAAGFAGELTNATALEMNIMSAVTSEQSTNPITPNTYKLWNFTGKIIRGEKEINAYLVTPRENEYVKFEKVNLRIQNGVRTITDSEHLELPIDETYFTLEGVDWNAFPLEAIVKTRPTSKESKARGIAADREWVIYPVKQGDINTGVDAITGNANAAIVKGGAGVINITAVAQGKVDVYSTAGALVANQSIAEGSNTISIAAGLYIVRIDGKATKVVVR